MASKLYLKKANGKEEVKEEEKEEEERGKW